MEPSAAPAAKAGPRSRTRKKATGPEVRGSATITPPTPCPQRRPTRLAEAISVGVRNSLSANRWLIGEPQPQARRADTWRGEPQPQARRVDTWRGEPQPQARRADTWRGEPQPQARRADT